MPPLLSPPKGGRRIKGISRFLLSQTNQPAFSKFMVPGIFWLGRVTWDFWLDFGDVIALLYTYVTSLSIRKFLILVFLDTF